MDRRYEQTWFKIVCGHNAPPEVIHKTMEEEAARRRDARKVKLLEILARRTAGVRAKQIAAERGWSVSYTRTQLRKARRWYGRES